MTTIDLKDLSPRQREAWLMRFRYGWRIKRIALQMGTSFQAVSTLIRRAQRRAGIVRPRRIGVVRVKPRLTGVQSLSDIFDY